MKIIVALVAGLLFGLGLSLGGMTQPAVVLGFLDVFGAWNPRLIFVMGAAVLTTGIGYRWVLRRKKPLLDATFHVPTARHLDRRLLGGAALFGTGWGVAGYCPGPALASIGALSPSLLLLVGSMLAGWWIASKIPANVAT
ncbi:DUF6691 family protein [Rhodanobacter sp. BL-MT-08]